jgi:hypothetical protein
VGKNKYFQNKMELAPEELKGTLWRQIKIYPDAMYRKRELAGENW